MLAVTISHLINVAVAGSMSFLLITNNRNTKDVFGEATPARQILSSLYLAIAATSAFALIQPQFAITIALVLFPLQIFYKLSTLVTVSSKHNPIVC